MNRNRILVTVGCVCASVIIAGAPSVQAANKVEIDTAVAGLSVAMNNFYAGTENPEDELKDYLQSAPVQTEPVQEEEKEEEKEVSPYENIAVSQVSGDEDYVNIRDDASVDGEVLGKIYNNCAATIEETVEKEDGTWYKIHSGSVEGYIKAEFFVTGEEAEQVAVEIGKSYAQVAEGGLRLREEPTTESDVIDTLWQGDIYTVVEQDDDFVKLSLGQDDDGNDVAGYVAKEYVNTYVKFDEAISLEEEQAKLEEQARLEEEAREAEEALRREEERQQEANRQNSVNETPATSAPTTATQAPAPETSAAPTVPETPAAPPVDTSSASRDAVVAYAKQFIGCPYVYGGNSLSGGTDCSGFTSGVYAHFGISIPRTSRAQAGVGRRISVGELQPGDLIFYANGGSIYHVAMYIGGGQIIHAIDESQGINITPLNTGRVYTAVSLF